MAAAPRRWTLVAAAATAVAACGSPEVTVGKARLAEAWGVVAAPAGPTVEVLPGRAAEVPAGDGPVRLAIDRDVPYREVDTLIAALRKAGRQPVPLVARGRDVRGFVVELPTDEEAIRVVATNDGKACVSPPGVAEAKCVQSPDEKHIDRAFTRELVREAVKGYDLDVGAVWADPELSWADIVRAVDGIRTCCGDTEVRATLHSNL